MPSTEEQIKRLKYILGEVEDLNHASSLAGWDQQTYMPAGGAEDRGYMLGTLSRLAHQAFTSPEVGQLLEDLAPGASQFDPDSDEAALVRVTTRLYRKQVQVPANLVEELAYIASVGHQAWARARAQKDFPFFEPYLKRILELRRQYANIFAPFDHVYDPLLDDFEPGLSTADLKGIFDKLRPQQVALIQAIADRPPVDDSFLCQSLDRQKQWDFGVDVITRFGYDWQRGRQDLAAHPFTTSFGLDDVRITTRFDPKLSISALMSTMHECGHALYDQGFSKSLMRTPLATGASLAIHESQSRMWENLVGRSKVFWEFFLPRLQQIFPSEFGTVNLDRFYRGLNKVERSFIRVEADEATYNLHIMLRLELEIELMQGSLDVHDLPDAWRARMQDYLSINPPDDALGVLQDVHWSGGMIGYFPTYALGNLISVQLWEKINQDIPDLPGQIRQGEFRQLLEWLRTHIHQHGAKYEPQELVEKVTGSKIDPDPYLRYLREKFGEVYNL